MNKKLLSAITIATTLFCSCAKANQTIIEKPLVVKDTTTKQPVVVTPPVTPVITDTTFYAKGADIGWLSQMEKEGVKFYDNNGIQKDCIELLKSKGINSIRLRVWVNPSAAYCTTSDVVAQAIRAKNMGMKIMIDFHYSDWWADPGKQNKPAAWKNLSFDALTSTLYTYTKEVLTALNNNGITPTWIQIGNETNDGMLWEDGRASKSMSNFATLLNAGSKAVREIMPTSKIIVHVSNGYDNAMFRWMFDGLTNNKVDYDVIAMSLYPDPNNWAATNEQCFNNMKDMIARYNKEIMISEVGMDNNKAAECKSFLLDIIQKNKSLENHKGLGVFYWEPECFNNWQGYNMGAFTNEGKPSIAMDAFLN
jgi:arabinogalactan endo-1,4-beta-galactosidase